ncbi:MAG: YbaB/EbfC family nucleoid-associated protein [Alphaproteobacteria bacterium]
MQQAKQMKENMAEAEAELNQTMVTGVAPSSLVEVVMNCKGEFESVKIDPVTLEDKEMLESLILVALKDARAQANTKTTEVMKKATGGLDLPPGLLPF